MFENPKDISVVIPVHNEESVIPDLFRRLRETLEKTKKPFEIIFVDDGSQDGSFLLLKSFYEQHKNQVRVLRLSRNFGHQLAITAGLEAAKGKAVVVMDADLQDPPEIIFQFLEKWQQGYEVVYGIRKERKGETLSKKMTAALFYKLIRIGTALDIPENVGDFYLLDRKVVDVLNTMKERHRFMRGMVVWAGFRRLGVEYVREPRFAGKTKYSFFKMLKFSFDAATSFSFTPLRVISFIGGAISILSFLSILLIIYMKLFTDRTITGWSSLMAVVLFIGGIQLLSIGLIGEYIARIGDDVKRRPLYAMSDRLG